MVTRSPFLTPRAFSTLAKRQTSACSCVVGELFVVLRIVAFPDDGRLIAALGEMAVDAVVTDVQRAVLEPLDRHVVRVVGGVLHLAEGLDPVDALGLLGPETVRVLDRSLIHLLVFGVVDEGALPPFGRYVIDLF